MDCDPEEYGACDSGCSGGLMNSAFEYTLKNGGLEKEKDYPYTGTDRGSCKFDRSKIAASVTNFSVVSTDEHQIAANLRWRMYWCYMCSRMVNPIREVQSKCSICETEFVEEVGEPRLCCTGWARM